MFWKLIRWGGTVIVMLLVLAATFFASPPDGPADEQMQSNKNFNL